MSKIMSNQEKMNTAYMAKGCINRICVSDDIVEIANLIPALNWYIGKIVESRTEELRVKND